MPDHPPHHYRLLAIDLDGTLLNTDHELAAENRAALHRAHEAGLQVVLCTGRAYPETKPIVDQIGLDLDATITVFGAVVTDVASGRSLETTPFDPAIADKLLRWFQARDYAVLWLIDGATHGFDGWVINGAKRHPAVDGYLFKSPIRMECVDQPVAEPAAPLRLSVIDDAGQLDELAAAMQHEFADSIAFNVLHAPSWNLTVVEAFAREVNKWFGIEKLCRRWNIPREKTIAIGDDVNDLEMVRQAGLGVAMANARDEVKQVARHVTGSNDENGVAQLIDAVIAGEFPRP